MKKILAAVMLLAVIVSLASCGGGSVITVISREEGSGTRGAFVELTGVLGSDKLDKTSKSAEITNSTQVVISSVAGNKNAIGYISLGSLNDTVKAVKVEGSAATADNVNNGTYKLVRPFMIATSKDANAITRDFINYIMSPGGQAIIEDRGYISVSGGTEYASSGLSGTIRISGSTSIAPLMEKLKEAYVKLNPNVTVELQQNDSSTGMKDVGNGTSDIGMASRDIKESELKGGDVVGKTIAKDGIAVIINKNNEVDSLTMDQIKKIYTGEITDWSEIEE